MRRFLLILFALCLCCSAAAAEVSVTGKTVEASSLSPNEYANTFVIRNESKKYQVVDPDMNPLSDEYAEINIRDGLYIIEDENQKCGLLDGSGRMLIAPAYDDVKVVDANWAIGITLKEATADNYDYETWFSTNKQFYLIDTIDLFYQGNNLATLSRSDWYSASTYGDYIIIQDRERNRAAYNKEFVKSEAVPEYSSEYNDDYRTHKVIHVGSGQQAFVDGCTLTPEEVQQYLWIDDDDQLIDLQGNWVADLSDYIVSHTVDRETNLIRVKNNKKKAGLLDSSGNILVPCKYDELGYDLESSIKMGYIYAVKDGKGGFVSLKDGEETGFEFIESAGQQRSAFIIVEDPREGTILISAVAGELPGRYKEVNIPYYTAALFATVKDFDDTIHVIDAYGNDALEDSPEIRSVYDVTYFKDGSMILVRDVLGIYHIYTVSFSEDPEEVSEPEATAAPAETPPGPWTCENGHEGNTGKFCSECGSPRPQ